MSCPLQTLITPNKQLRTGDINLHNSDSAFFARLKAQLDAILERYHVHYTLLAEAPEKEDGPAFDFLADIFREDVGSKTKVSFANTLDVPTSLLHMMNADMLITTGSSFPYIAATLSPKVSSCTTKRAGSSKADNTAHRRSSLFLPFIN